MIEATIIQAVVGLLSGLAGILLGTRATGRTNLRIDDLEANRLAKIERKIESLDQGGCRVGARVEQKLDDVSAQLTGISQQMELYKRDTNELRAQRAADLDYLKNLDGSIQRHKREGHGS